MTAEMNKIAGAWPYEEYERPDEDACPVLPAGIHRIPPEAYHRDPAQRPSLSSSLVETLLTSCPARARLEHPRLTAVVKDDPSRIMDIGTAFHSATLGRGPGFAVYPPEVLSKTGSITAVAKEWAAEQRAAGLVPMKEADAERIPDMALSMKAKLHKAGITIDPDYSELVAIAEVDGVLCRAMIDYAPPGVDWILDLKAQETAAPADAARWIANRHYDARAAHYLAVYNAATGEKRSRVIFGLCEREVPHFASVVRLFGAKGDPADWMEDAHSKAAWARATWGRCLTNDDWPDYGDGLFEIGAPSFHRKAWEAFGANTFTPAPEPERRPSKAALETARMFMSPEGLQ